MHKKITPYVPIKKWVIAVQESGYLLGQLGTNNDYIPGFKSGSIIKAKLAVLEIKTSSTKDNINEILADILKGERNRTPMGNQYSIQCPSIGLVNCTKSFCDAKKWWDIRPHNSNRTSNTIYVHCSNHSNGIYETNKITHAMLKVVDNHIQILFFTIPSNMEEIINPYFDYEEKNGGLIG